MFIFNRILVLAMLVFSSAASTENIRGNRALTVCPAVPPSLSCSIYKDGVAIANMDSQTSKFILKEYEAGSCYNIRCEKGDRERNSFVKFTGQFTFPDGTTQAQRQDPDRVAWLVGSGRSTDCVDLARSCKDLSVTIESWRKPAPFGQFDPVYVAQHMCTSKKVSCSSAPVVPRPAKCVLDRNHQTIQFEPNFPAKEENAYIEVYVEKTQKIYQYKDFDTSLSEFKIEKLDEYEEMRQGGKLRVRFVTPSYGPGKWTTCRYSPIGLDINGSGEVERITGEFNIDITGKGDNVTLHEWFAPTEGILIDNKNGVEHGVVTGQHLLGDMGGKFKDGFHKLKKYDMDRNGVVEGEELKHFMIWVDSNSNALLDYKNNEMHSLAEYGIIGLRTSNVYEVSFAILADGRKMIMQDLWFAR